MNIFAEISRDSHLAIAKCNKSWRFQSSHQITHRIDRVKCNRYAFLELRHYTLQLYNEYILNYLLNQLGWLPMIILQYGYLGNR